MDYQVHQRPSENLFVSRLTLALPHPRPGPCDREDVVDSQTPHQQDTCIIKAAVPVQEELQAHDVGGQEQAAITPADQDSLGRWVLDAELELRLEEEG